MASFLSNYKSHYYKPKKITITIKNFQPINFTFLRVATSQSVQKSKYSQAITTNMKIGQMHDIWCTVLGGPNITANLYCSCLGSCFMFLKADAVQICDKFWDTSCIKEGQ